jgi:hypothetical protein
MKALFLFSYLFLSLSSAPLAAAWGNLGHRTVGYLAEKYLSNAGRIYIMNILGDVDISDAAIWADWYKNTPEGKDTGSWHFINAHDSPPKSCDLDFARDCGDGCIVTAILNTVGLVSEYERIAH